MTTLNREEDKIFTYTYTISKLPASLRYFVLTKLRTVNSIRVMHAYISDGYSEFEVRADPKEIDSLRLHAWLNVILPNNLNNIAEVRETNAVFDSEEEEEIPWTR